MHPIEVRPFLHGLKSPRGISTTMQSIHDSMQQTHMCTHTQFLFLTLSLFSQSVHVHECTHLCTHIVMYTACTPCICHTYSTYTYSTLALLQNLVHNTYIHSCTVHLYAHILMKNIKHVYTHSHTHVHCT